MNYIVYESDSSFIGSLLSGTDLTLPQVQALKQKNGRKIVEVTDDQLDQIFTNKKANTLSKVQVLTDSLKPL